MTPTPTAAALSAIASQRRRDLLRLVWERELSAGELASHFDISWPAISQQLGTLKEVGLVRERRDGRHRFYTTDEATVGALAGILSQMWSEDLHRLAELAEEDEQNDE